MTATTTANTHAKTLAKSPADTTILVTGGAGFIGSHTVVELLNAGYNVVVLDDLSNSSEESLTRVRQICNLPGLGTPEGDRLQFVRGSILDRAILEDTFAGHDIDGIIHFAGFKAVGEAWRSRWNTT